MSDPYTLRNKYSGVLTFYFNNITDMIERLNDLIDMDFDFTDDVIIREGKFIFKTFTVNEAKYILESSDEIIKLREDINPPVISIITPQIEYTLPSAIPILSPCNESELSNVSPCDESKLPIVIPCSESKLPAITPCNESKLSDIKSVENVRSIGTITFLVQKPKAIIFERYTYDELKFLIKSTKRNHLESYVFIREHDLRIFKYDNPSNRFLNSDEYLPTELTDHFINYYIIIKYIEKRELCNHNTLLISIGERFICQKSMNVTPNNYLRHLVDDEILQQKIKLDEKIIDFKVFFK